MSETDFYEKANLLWAIADKLTGVYKPHEYGLVILPLTVLRRFDCVLAPTKDKVLQVYEQNKASGVVDVAMDALLRNAAGFPFYNVSKFTFERLVQDPENIASNLRAYINGFSSNVRDIVEKFKFDVQIATMAEKGILYLTVKEFTGPAGDFHPARVSDMEMGYIFEEIIRRFSESHNEDAGQHYTPREVIELMTNLLFINDPILAGDSISRTIYDPACGTGGMLSVAESHVAKYNHTARLLCFGQELNDETYAICKADRLIKGGQEAHDLIECANTLSDDRFADRKFDYIISNPPFGREWKNEKTAVEAEAKLGDRGRFGVGLPPISDSQMLFLLTAVFKMKPAELGGGRVAIIQNGSPLFSGGAGSGQSEIRRYLCEHDLLDAIVALPNDIFYNTGIATYIWILDNHKPAERRSKIQLINANGLFEKRRKSLGNKRNDIPPSAIEEITKLYGDFRETELSKIFDAEDFGYREITVERPLVDAQGKPILKKGKPQPDPDLRDTEDVPLKEDVQTYFEREVLPFAPDAWIDKTKTQVGYEIPFTQHFYKYVSPRPSDEIIPEIMELNSQLNIDLKVLFQK